MMPPDFDVVVRGGTLIRPGGRALLDLCIRDGRVAATLPQNQDATASRTIDAAGLFVLPGMVDTHVHLMEPGDPTREDFPSGSAAAAANGVTTIVEHTHGWPVTTVERLREKRALLRGRSHVDYGLAAHLWSDNFHEIAGLWAEGAVFFKIFTCATHGVPATCADRMLSALKLVATLQAVCLIHCEDDLITAQNERLLRAHGRTDGGLLPEWRSRESELVAAGMVALLARLAGARTAVAHASNPDVLDLLDTERARGAAIVAESCPQYLYLREDEVAVRGALRKFTPPARIRNRLDEEAMWHALRNGRIHHLSTDHAPATREQKSHGMWDSHFGLPGLDSTFPLLLDAALRGRISLERLVEAYAEAPARWYGLSAKGSLEPGHDADIVLVDPSGSRVLTDEGVISKAGWTPYEGRQVQGTIAQVLLRGEPIAEHGRPRGSRRGRYLAGPGAEPIASRLN
jgi:dihydroorotase (multifunctional complex type)